MAEKCSCNKFLYALGGFTVLITLIHLFRWGGGAYDSITSWINILASVIGVIAGVSAMRHFGLKNDQGKAILLITIQLAIWFIADMLWTFVFEEAVVSISDVLWILGYPLIFVATLYGIRSIDPDYFKNWPRLVFSIAVILLIVFLYLKAFPLAWDSEISVAENLSTGAYTIGDIVLMIPVVLLISLVITGFYSIPWVLIGLGIVSTFIGDVIYTINYETYAGGDLVDVLWYLQYILFAAAFIVLTHKSHKIIGAMKEIKKE